eukprot:582657-Prymnesium_polylepis.1
MKAGATSSARTVRLARRKSRPCTERREKEESARSSSQRFSAGRHISLPAYATHTDSASSA